MTVEFAHAEAFRFLQAGSGYADAVELEAHFRRVLAAFGFGPYACVRLNEQLPQQDPRIISSHGLEDWEHYYAEQGYDSADPVRRWYKTGKSLYSWGQAKAWNARLHEPANDEAMWSDASQAGLNEGLVVVSNAPGGHVLLTRIMTEQKSIRPSDRAILDSVAICFATWRMRLLEQAGDVNTVNSLLTPREAECLRWVGQGLTDYAIAEQMDISPSTANKHIENAKRKLGVPKRMQAFRRATDLDLLAP